MIQEPISRSRTGRFRRNMQSRQSEDRSLEETRNYKQIGITCQKIPL